MDSHYCEAQNLCNGKSKHDGGVAILGMSCRFPGANSPQEFWEILSTGRDYIGPIPAERPQAIRFGDRRATREYVEGGFLKCAVDEFDAKFFGISPQEATFMDPQQRMLLELTWESLEDAGVNPDDLKKDSVGVYVGIWQQDYDNMLPTGLGPSECVYRYTGNSFSATAARISYYYGLNGPNLAIDSGCSSSLAAVHLACESLCSGQTTLAIACGVNLMLNTESPFGSVKSKVLSKSFRCKTFDDDADGYVPAEGCGVVVLKQHRDAVRDGDYIRAIIRGSALNNDGARKSFGTPNEQAQESVIREALAKANVEPREVSLVEAHGTGTIVGDPIEFCALGSVYSTLRTNVLHISSVKSNIGHTESSAGIAGLIKVILCIQNKSFPPHLHFKKLNLKIELDSIPAKIPLCLTPWDDNTKIAGVSSFGMSGTNVHVIVQEPVRDYACNEPITNNSVDIIRKPQVIQISAKTEIALQELITNYVNCFKQMSDTSLEAIAFGTNVCRAHLPYRVSIFAKTVQELIAKLQTRTNVPTHTAGLKPRIVFLFTGQGSQYIGMGRNLYEIFMPFRKALDECNVMFEQTFGQSLLDVMWSPTDKFLEYSMLTQPTIFCLQYSLVQLWRSFGIVPDVVLGHSVGEYAAAVCVGVMTLHGAFTLVSKRSRLIEKLRAGRMLVLKTSEIKTAAALKKFRTENSDCWLDIAAINSDAEIVVAGEVDVITKFQEYCGKFSITTQLLPLSRAFHSRAVDSILQEFENAAAQVQIELETLKTVYISGTSARRMIAEDFNSAYWCSHLRNTVNYAAAVKKVWEYGVQCFLEIGPTPILLGLTLENLGSKTDEALLCPSMCKNEENWMTVFTTLGKLYETGVEVNWSNWFGQLKKETVHNLPKYPFQRQKYWYKHAQDDELYNPVNLKPACKFHPILGQLCLSPSAQSSFYNQVNIASHDLEYLADHVVAGKIILPPAVYLEMIMAAGAELYYGTGQKCPQIITDLRIEGALDLDSPVNIHTLLSPVTSFNDQAYTVEIFRHLSGNNWKRHGCGNICPEITESVKIDIHEAKGRMTIKDKSLLIKLYAAARNVGFDFGSKFQSICSAWSKMSEDSVEVLTQISVPATAQYICHPIGLDAMLQTHVFRAQLSELTDIESLQLQFPICIRKFAWISMDEFTTEVYVHTMWKRSNPGADTTVNLLNQHGQLLAAMEGIDMVETTVNSLLKSLRSEEIKIPNLWQETWDLTKPTINERVSLQLMKPAPADLVTTTLADLKKHEIVFTEATKKLGNACTEALVSSFVEIGWDLEDGKVVNTQKILDELPQDLKNSGFLEYCLKIFEELSYARCIDGSWRIVKVLPSINEAMKLTSKLTNQAAELIGMDAAEIGFAKWFINNVSQVLTAEMTSLQLLFPDEPQAIGAQKFYENAKLFIDTTEVAIAQLLDIISQILIHPKQKIQILEVGGGTGASTALVLERLNSLGISFNYTFTDISPVFVSECRKKFGDTYFYEIFNIEDDPLSQNFPPGHFDFILAFQVLHATKNLYETLANLNIVLRPSGSLIFCEQLDEIRLITLPFGLLDSWWRFNDDRKMSPICSPKEWTQRLTGTGFEDVNVIEMFDHSIGVLSARKSIELKLINKRSELAWLVGSDESGLALNVIKKLHAHGRDVYAIEDDKGLIKFRNILDQKLNWEGVLYFCTEEKCQQILACQEKCGKFLHLFQAVVQHFDETRRKPRICVVTRGTNYVGDDPDLGHPNVSTVWGLLKSFCSEYPNFPTVVMDTNPIAELEMETDQIFSEIWTMKKERELFVAFRNGNRYVQRLIPLNILENEVALPKSSRYTFVNPASKLVSDIQFAPAGKLKGGGDNVEVSVMAAGLNFRDFFLINRPLNFPLLEGDPKKPGYEVAGIVVATGPDVRNFKIGDPVFGITLQGGFQSHVIVPEHFMILKPGHISYTAAVTVPIAYLTAHQTLAQLARISHRDRVLIHSASGGVGLAAIQIARNVGAEIYATAGTKRKREYLRSLGITHIYDSRTTNFSQQILKNGTSITVVLNSITKEGFKEASLSCCAQGAYFIEIGRLNIWTAEEVKIIRPDIKYIPFDIASITLQDQREVSNILKTLEPFFLSGKYTPLPLTEFPLQHIREAFSYFETLNHIGKIVLKMPSVEVGKFAWRHHIFNKENTYLITGGLGGLGLKVLKWMTTSGAVNIVLAGRRPPSQDAQAIIDSLNLSGSSVVTFATDVTDYAQCAELVTKIKHNLPPLRGIIHAAGVLSEGGLLNQNRSKFETVLAAKAYSAWHLHDLTKTDTLDFFIMFSSMASFIGSASQSNYSAASRFLDSLAHYRHAMGLPASTINWGSWSDVGAAANTKVHASFKPMTPNEGMTALDYILRNHLTQVGVSNIEDWGLLKQSYAQGNYFSKIKSSPTKEKKHTMATVAYLVEEIRNAPNHEQRRPMIGAYIEEMLRDILKVDPIDELDWNQDFMSFGVDSLTTMKLRNCLQRLLVDQTLNAGELQQYCTISSMANHINILMNSDYVTPSNTNSVHEIILQDLNFSVVPPEIGPLIPSKMRQILLTGVTGHLGANFLPELLERNLKVFCLIRANDKLSARERMGEILKKFGINSNLEHVRIVVGDISKMRLGLVEKEFEELGTKIDGIIHCAIDANHFENYYEKGSQNSLRETNVAGLKNIIEFATTYKTKPMLHASSIAAITEFEQDGKPVENYPALESVGLDILNGYALSKFIGEKILAKTERAGVPVTVIRYPIICGNSRTGEMRLEKDHAYNFLRASLGVRMFPKMGENKGIPIMPPDVAAKISVDLFFNDASDTGIYNFIGGSFITDDVIQDVMKGEGIDCELVSLRTWRNAVFQNLNENELAPMVFLYEDTSANGTEDMKPRIANIVPLTKNWARGNLGKLSDKLRKNFPGVEELLIPARDLLQKHVDEIIRKQTGL